MLAGDKRCLEQDMSQQSPTTANCSLATHCSTVTFPTGPTCQSYWENPRLSNDACRFLSLRKP